MRRARRCSTLARSDTGVVRKQDTALLVTHHGTPASDSLASLVATNVPHELWCEQTKFGPRFEGEPFETLVYPDAIGMQTTLAFWHDVLRTRAMAAGVSVEPVVPEVTKP